MLACRRALPRAGLLAAARQQRAQVASLLPHLQQRSPEAEVVEPSSRLFSTTGLSGTQLPVSSSCCPTHAIAMAATSAAVPRRSYSSTRPVWNKDGNDSNDDESNSERPLFETINNTGLTDEEIEKLFEEEEARVRAEEEAKYVPNWKPGMRKRRLLFSHSLEELQYDMDPDKYEPRWSLRDKRCGALAIKMGMMPVFDPQWGIRYPCTVLLLDQNVVLGHKTLEKNGYRAIQVAAGQRKRKNVGKSVLGQYMDKKDGTKGILSNDEGDTENPPYLVREFRVTDDSLLVPIGTKIHARHFVPGQNVDIAGISKGKGFQGAMKRHNFKGMPASHGVSKSHRALGSTGQCQDPGRVFKGKKMAGRMGTDRVTVQNLRIIKMDRGRNLLYVQGGVPGNKGSFVEIRDAVKKPLWNSDMVEGSLDRPPLPTFEFDEEIDGCGEAGHEVFMPFPNVDPLAPDLDEEAA